jgi:hypothetical protein
MYQRYQGLFFNSLSFQERVRVRLAFDTPDTFDTLNALTHRAPFPEIIAQGVFRISHKSYEIERLFA